MALANDSAKDVNLTQQGHSTACGRVVCLLPAAPLAVVVVVVGRQNFCFASSLVSMVMVEECFLDFCDDFKFFVCDVMGENVKMTK